MLLLCLCKLSFVGLVMLVFANCPDFSRVPSIRRESVGSVWGVTVFPRQFCVFLCVHMLSCLVFCFLSLRLGSARSLMSRYRVLLAACALRGPARVWLMSSSMTSGWPCGTKPRWYPCRRIWRSGWAACWVNLLTLNSLSVRESKKWLLLLV